MIEPHVLRSWSRCAIVTKTGRTHRCASARWLLLFQVEPVSRQTIQVHILEGKLLRGGEVVVPWDNLDHVTTGEAEEDN